MANVLPRGALLVIVTWVGDGEICRFSEVTIEKGDNCLYDGETFLSSSGGKF